MSENCIGSGEIKVIETEPESEESRLARKERRNLATKRSMQKRFDSSGVKGVIVYCHVSRIDLLKKYAKAMTDEILRKQQEEREKYGKFNKDLAGGEIFFDELGFQNEIPKIIMRSSKLLSTNLCESGVQSKVSISAKTADTESHDYEITVSFNKGLDDSTTVKSLVITSGQTLGKPMYVFQDIERFFYEILHLANTPSETQSDKR